MGDTDPYLHRICMKELASTVGLRQQKHIVHWDVKVQKVLVCCGEGGLKKVPQKTESERPDISFVLSTDEMEPPISPEDQQRFRGFSFLGSGL